MTVSEKLRLVQGLYSHAEMFGFHWDDGSDWTWHDVACKIADEIDAENARLKKERNHWRVERVHARSNWEDAYKRATELEAENAKLRELVRDFDKCLDTILGLTGCKGFVILPDQELFDSLPVRMCELGVGE